MHVNLTEFAQQDLPSKETCLHLPEANTEVENQLSNECQALALPTFHRDLPDLLRDYPGQWVAYQGSRRLGFAATKTKLYQECLRRGLSPAQFELFCIEAEMPNPVEVNWPRVS